MVHFKIVSVDGRMFEFTFVIADVIKIGIIDNTDMGSLIVSYIRYRNDNLGDSLNIIDSI